jgi:phosphatidylglycerophosphate synthase
MKKTPTEYENPVDNEIYRGVELIAPSFYKLGFTPNMVTTIANVFNVACVYSIFQKHYVWASAFYFIGYFFDCLDGYLARKYNMVTQYGDWYDHISDTLKFIGVCFALYKLNRFQFLICLPLIIVSLLCTCVFFSFQEKLYDKSDHSASLELLSKLCFAKTSDEAKEHMKYIRYMGCGTFTVIMMLIIGFYGVNIRA